MRSSLSLSMNDFCIDVGDGDKVEASYICDEGTWVKGVNGNCLKGDDNIFPGLSGFP